MKLLIALLMLPLSVSALDLELGCGQTLYEKPGNGEWFQKEFEHSSANLSEFGEDKEKDLIGYENSWIKAFYWEESYSWIKSMIVLRDGSLFKF
jgi:hypothetical protein